MNVDDPHDTPFHSFCSLYGLMILYCSFHKHITRLSAAVNGVSGSFGQQKNAPCRTTRCAFVKG
jgi:hypothetical protein